MKHTRTAIKIGLSSLFLLLVPLVAIRFTSEVNWNINDFIVAGAMLFSASTAFSLALVNFNTKSRRVLAGIAIVIVFVLLWAELAVGIFNSPIAGS